MRLIAGLLRPLSETEFGRAGMRSDGRLMVGAGVLGCFQLYAQMALNLLSTSARNWCESQK
jgi:hypothetical protein